MRILIISQYYYPEQFLINDIAPRLVERGNDVCVVCGVPNYPAGIVYPGYEHGKRNEEIINNVRVIRCNNKPRKQGKVKLLINYLSFMFAADKKCHELDHQYDVVFLYQLTPILQAYPAIRYAKRNDCKLICYCLDLAPASGEDVAGKNKAIFWIYKRFSKWAYSNCDSIAVTSKDFIDYLSTVHGIDRGKIYYLPQHADERLLHKNLDKDGNGTPNFLFAGNIGYGARLDHVIRVAKRLNEEGYCFHISIVGDGSEKNNLIKLSESLNTIGYVTFYSSVPMDEVYKYYRDADALLVTLRKGQLTIPGKVQAYMATGKPIIGAMDGSGKNLIVETSCGVCGPAEDEKQLYENMKHYLTNPLLFKEFGKNGKKYFSEHFRLDTFTDKLLVLLKK